MALNPPPPHSRAAGGSLVLLERIQDDLDRLRLDAGRVRPLLRGCAKLQELGVNVNRDDNKICTRQKSMSGQRRVFSQRSER